MQESLRKATLWTLWERLQEATAELDALKMESAYLRAELELHLKECSSAPLV